MTKISQLFSILTIVASPLPGLAARASPDSSWFESFAIDAFPCDLAHEPIPEKTYQAGDFARICIQTTPDADSDLIVTGMHYFLFSTEQTENAEKLALLLQEKHAESPSIACTEDNMCVVEAILDGHLFENENTKIYGYGSVVLERGQTKEAFAPMNDITLSLKLQPDVSSEPKMKYLRGKTNSQ